MLKSEYNIAGSSFRGLLCDLIAVRKTGRLGPKNSSLALCGYTAVQASCACTQFAGCYHLWWTLDAPLFGPLPRPVPGCYNAASRRRNRKPCSQKRSPTSDRASSADPAFSSAPGVRLRASQVPPVPFYANASPTIVLSSRCGAHSSLRKKCTHCKRNHAKAFNYIDVKL